MAALDFGTARVQESLQNLAQVLQGKETVPPVPVLSSANSPAIHLNNPNRSAITIVGWNLHEAAKHPKKYAVIVQNRMSKERVVDRSYITFQGQYAVTIDSTSGGIPLH